MADVQDSGTGVRQLTKKRKKNRKERKEAAASAPATPTQQSTPAGVDTSSGTNLDSKGALLRSTTVPRKERRKERMKRKNKDVGESAEVCTNIVSELRGSKRRKSSGAMAVDMASSNESAGKKLSGGSPSCKVDDAASPGVSAEVAELLLELKNPKANGSLSDRLNNKHRRFDKSLQKRWKLFTKKERALLVACDTSRITTELAKSAGIKHPFQANADDHCESAAEAYRDIAPVLTLLAKSLGKKPATLEIYDPFYCAGAVVDHFDELGFKSVYNKCEDFYEVIREGRVPPHDVVVTNPPYSGDHVERLLRWCRSNGKPFVLLMPNYFAKKAYYEDALGGADGAASMLYLFPWKRYVYWVPKGLRAKDKTQGHAGAGGNRTSPFVSFWYVDIAPVVTPRNLLKWWSSGAGGSPAAWAAKLCKLDKLPTEMVADEVAGATFHNELGSGTGTDADVTESLSTRLEQARARLLAQKAAAMGK